MNKLILCALFTFYATAAFASDGSVTVKTRDTYVVGSPKRF